MDRESLLIYDVIIIGGGVIGCCIARTLSKYDLQVALLEREGDIASGTTKANSGVVHAGYASPREYVKRDLCIEGNKLYTQAAEELNFPFQRNGSFVVALEDSQIKHLEEERKHGIQDGVPGLELILDKEKIKYMEPNLTDEVVGVLHAPSAGIVSPYEMTFALNHLGYFLLTNLMMGLLKKSEKARIINVSSGAHGGCFGINFDDLQMENGSITILHFKPMMFNVQIIIYFLP